MNSHFTHRLARGSDFISVALRQFLAAQLPKNQEYQGIQSHLKASKSNFFPLLHSSTSGQPLSCSLAIDSWWTPSPILRVLHSTPHTTQTLSLNSASQADRENMIAFSCNLALFKPPLPKSQLSLLSLFSHVQFFFMVHGQLSSILSEPIGFNIQPFFGLTRVSKAG
jgi:hypothetical protein